MNEIVRIKPMGGKLCDAVEYNGLIYLAGQVASKLDVGMKEQTADILRQIDALLAKRGSDKSRILTATVYVNDMALKPQMDEAWMAWVDAPTRQPAPQCKPNSAQPIRWSKSCASRPRKV